MKKIKAYTKKQFETNTLFPCFLLLSFLKLCQHPSNKENITIPFYLSPPHTQKRIIYRAKVSGITTVNLVILQENLIDTVMETHHQHQNKRENNVEKGISEQASPNSPSSSSSSPSHEFSFTISLHSSSTTIPANSKAPLPSLALDLSPADDIFFHGHLLPLHLLSHLPSSPHFSTNSFHSLKHSKDNDRSSNRSNITIDNIGNSNNSSNNNIAECNIIRTTKENKSKPSFSLFGLVRGHKGCQVGDKEDKEKHKKKLGFDVIHTLKRYLQIVQPLVLFRGRREKVGLQRQSYSHSGNLIRRNKPELRGRRGGYSSAPASMRTSPTNSNLLLATTALPPDNDSTMEEFQAAIQAAIVHCKNSIAKEAKC